MRRSLSLLLTVGLLIASCGDSEADGDPATLSAGTTTSTVETATTTAVITTAATTETTETEAVAGDQPLGLSAEDIPATMAEVYAVFGAMPDVIDGVPREVAQYGFEARYGELNGLLAIEIEAGAGVESMSFFGDLPGAVIQASQLDPTAPLLWMFASMEDDGGAGGVQMAQWCEPEGSWLFTVNAATAAMRDSMVSAFVEAAHTVKEAGPLEATGDIAALETLRETLPSEEELSALLGVPNLSLEVTGGPGVTDWIFEHTDMQGMIGGYMAAFGDPAGFAGSFSVTLFATEADVVAVLGGIPEGEEAQIIRSEFPVTDLLTRGRGLVYDPEPDSHFTDILGYTGPVLMHVLVFHGADDDLIDQARGVVEVIVANLEAIG